MASIKVSSVCRFVEAFIGQRVFVGIDVHKKTFSVALLRPDGMIKDWSCPADVALVTQTLSSLPVEIGAVCYEAGPTGFGLARSLRASKIKAIVVAPSRVPRPVSPTNKTDSLDCRKLAEYAASGLVHSIAIPSEKEEAFRSLERRRHQITDSLRKAKQRIRALLLALGEAEPHNLDHWSKNAMNALKALSLPPGAMDTLQSLINVLEYLISAQRYVDQRLRTISQEQDEARRIAAMRAVPGVGEVVATTFAAEVFRPGRFNRSEEVTAYLGLAPVVRQSGLSKGTARLRPVGQRRLRSLLIEAAWMWKQQDPWAQNFYNRILGRHGVPQKAIAALARKLAALLWELSLPAAV